MRFMISMATKTDVRAELIVVNGRQTPRIEFVVIELETHPPRVLHHRHAIASQRPSGHGPFLC
jgi:hypothetical protein